MGWIWICTIRFWKWEINTLKKRDLSKKEKKKRKEKNRMFLSSIEDVPQSPGSQLVEVMPQQTIPKLQERKNSSHPQTTPSIY